MNSASQPSSPALGAANPPVGGWLCAWPPVDPSTLVPLAPTAFTPDAGSVVPWLPPPFVDHRGASPGGVFRDPGTNDWLPVIGSVIFTCAPDAPVVLR
jgi:hypothetical protein